MTKDEDFVTGLVARGEEKEHRASLTRARRWRLSPARRGGTGRKPKGWSSWPSLLFRTSARTATGVTRKTTTGECRLDSKDDILGRRVETKSLTDPFPLPLVSSRLVHARAQRLPAVPALRILLLEAPAAAATAAARTALATATTTQPSATGRNARGRRKRGGLPTRLLRSSGKVHHRHHRHHLHSHRRRRRRRRHPHRWTPPSARARTDGTRPMGTASSCHLPRHQHRQGHRRRRRHRLCSASACAPASESPQSST